MPARGAAGCGAQPRRCAIARRAGAAADTRRSDLVTSLGLGNSSARCTDVSKGECAASLGTELITFQHVFHHDENLLPAILIEINTRIEKRGPLPPLQKRNYTDTDKNLIRPETREFFVAGAKANVRGSEVALAVYFRMHAGAQSAQWWVLMRGFVDRNKKVSLLASAPIALPLWLWARLKQDLDLAMPHSGDGLLRVGAGPRPEAQAAVLLRSRKKGTGIGSSGGPRSAARPRECRACLHYRPVIGEGPLLSCNKDWRSWYWPLLCVAYDGRGDFGALCKARRQLVPKRTAGNRELRPRGPCHDHGALGDCCAERCGNCYRARHG